MADRPDKEDRSRNLGALLRKARIDAGQSRLNCANILNVSTQAIADFESGEADIAVTVACPVIAKHPARHKLVIYGGAVHLSKESIVVDDRPLFGYVAPITLNGWGSRFEQAQVVSLSQEHGLIQADADTINQLNVGDLVAVLPVHSCLTVDLLRKYMTLSGEHYTCMPR